MTATDPATPAYWRAKRDDLRAKAEQWIEDNPDAFALFERFALQMAERRRRFGIGLLAERVRWETRMLWQEGEFKINNNYRAYIARELTLRHPQLAEFIETRRVRC